MLWKTHVRISFEVLNRLRVSLSPEVAESFKEGIVAPDKWQDYPHHYGKSEKIREYLMKARAYFLKGELSSAFFHLGVALHYIQDSHTSFASFYPKHHRWEESIDNSNFVYDLTKTINYSLRNKEGERQRCLRLAEALSHKAEGRDYTLLAATLSGHEQSKSFAKPIIDLNLALKASYVVVESVLSPKKCPALENKLEYELSNYQVIMKNSERELADKIIRLINERENLEKQKVPTAGFVSKMKNGLLGIRIKLKNWSANSNYNRYTKRKHLKKVVNNYLKASNRTIAPYVGWYNFQIPILNPNIVNKQLLTIQDIVKASGEDEQSLEDILSSHNVHCYSVGSNRLVRREAVETYIRAR